MASSTALKVAMTSVAVALETVRMSGTTRRPHNFCFQPWRVRYAKPRLGFHKTIRAVCDSGRCCRTAWIGLGMLPPMARWDRSLKLTWTGNSVAIRTGYEGIGPIFNGRWLSPGYREVGIPTAME